MKLLWKILTIYQLLWYSCLKVQYSEYLKKEEFQNGWNVSCRVYNGESGEPGQPGDDGVGIASIDAIPSADNTHTDI